MKIGLKLALSFCVMIILIIITIWIGLYPMNLIMVQMKDDAQVESQRTRLANEMTDNTREVSISIRNILLVKDMEQKSQIKLRIAEIRGLYDENFKKFEELIPDGDTATLRVCSIIKAVQEESRSLNNTVMELALAGKQDQAVELMNSQASPRVKQWISAIDELIKHENERTLVRYAEEERIYSTVRNLMFIIGAVTIGLALLISVLLTLSIVRPMKLSVQAARQIASNDLTVDLSSYTKRGDEAGIMMQSFSMMVKTLRQQLLEIQDGVNVLASSSNEILATTTQISSGAAETVSAISETTTTVEEVRHAAQLSSQKANVLLDSAQRLVGVSQTGRKAVDETVARMHQIQKQMETVSNTIVRLSEHGQQIGGIIASVNDVADQSNLLAVNAAIEAAKAGEMGRGFAVVAQEIKNLAQQSKLATTKVRTILNDIQNATSTAVLAIEQESIAVENGVKQSTQAGESIRILAENVTDSVNAATQIVASSQQQVIGMDQIGLAMTNINQASSENAISLTQSQKSAEILNELGQKLKNIVERFKM